MAGIAWTLHPALFYEKYGSVLVQLWDSGTFGTLFGPIRRLSASIGAAVSSGLGSKQASAEGEEHTSSGLRLSADTPGTEDAALSRANRGAADSSEEPSTSQCNELAFQGDIYTIRRRKRKQRDRLQKLQTKRSTQKGVLKDKAKRKSSLLVNKLRKKGKYHKLIGTGTSARDAEGTPVARDVPGEMAYPTGSYVVNAEDEEEDDQVIVGARIVRDNDSLRRFKALRGDKKIKSAGGTPLVHASPAFSEMNSETGSLAPDQENTEASDALDKVQFSALESLAGTPSEMTDPGTSKRKHKHRVKRKDKRKSKGEIAVENAEHELNANTERTEAPVMAAIKAPKAPSSHEGELKGSSKSKSSKTKEAEDDGREKGSSSSKTSPKFMDVLGLLVEFTPSPLKKSSGAMAKMSNGDPCLPYNERWPSWVTVDIEETQAPTLARTNPFQDEERLRRKLASWDPSQEDGYALASPGQIEIPVKESPGTFTPSRICKARGISISEVHFGESSTPPPLRPKRIPLVHTPTDPSLYEDLQWFTEVTDLSPAPSIERRFPSELASSREAIAATAPVTEEDRAIQRLPWSDRRPKPLPVFAETEIFAETSASPKESPGRLSLTGSPRSLSGLRYTKIGEKEEKSSSETKSSKGSLPVSTTGRLPELEKQMREKVVASAALAEVIPPREASVLLEPKHVGEQGKPVEGQLQEVASTSVISPEIKAEPAQPKERKKKLSKKHRRKHAKKKERKQKAPLHEDMPNGSLDLINQRIRALYSTEEPNEGWIASPSPVSGTSSALRNRQFHRDRARLSSRGEMSIRINLSTRKKATMVWPFSIRSPLE